MRFNTLLIFSFCVVSNQLLAQPTLTSADNNPVIGDVFNSHGGFYLSSPGSAGANVTWNFSAMTGSPMTPGTMVSPLSTTFASSFTASNVSLSAGSNNYQYFRSMTDSLLYFGGGSFSWLLTYSDPKRLLEYPFTYNSTFTDNYVSTMNNAGTIINTVGTTTVIADGYGTLKMPYANIPNVLRIKRVDDEDNTVNGSTTHSTLVTYNWYMPGIHQPLMVMNFVSASNYTVQYLDASTVGIPETSVENNFSIFFNESAKTICLNYTGIIIPVHLNFKLINIKGQILIDETISSEKEIFDAEKLVPGIYFYSVSDNEMEIKSGKLLID